MGNRRSLVLQGLLFRFYRAGLVVIRRSKRWCCSCGVVLYRVGVQDYKWRYTAVPIDVTLLLETGQIYYSRCLRTRVKSLETVRSAVRSAVFLDSPPIHRPLWPRSLGLGPSHYSIIKRLFIITFYKLFIIVRRAKAKWPRPQGPVSYFKGFELALNF